MQVLIITTGADGHAPASSRGSLVVGCTLRGFCDSVTTCDHGNGNYRHSDCFVLSGGRYGSW
jgi:hypothetical protein